MLSFREKLIFNWLKMLISVLTFTFCFYLFQIKEETWPLLSFSCLIFLYSFLTSFPVMECFFKAFINQFTMGRFLKSCDIYKGNYSFFGEEDFLLKGSESVEEVNHNCLDVDSVYHVQCHQKTIIFQFQRSGDGFVTIMEIDGILYPHYSDGSKFNLICSNIKLWVETGLRPVFYYQGVIHVIEPKSILYNFGEKMFLKKTVSYFVIGLSNSKKTAFISITGVLLAGVVAVVLSVFEIKDKPLYLLIILPFFILFVLSFYWIFRESEFEKKDRNTFRLHQSNGIASLYPNIGGNNDSAWCNIFSPSRVIYPERVFTFENDLNSGIELFYSPRVRYNGGMKEEFRNILNSGRGVINCCNEINFTITVNHQGMDNERGSVNIVCRRRSVIFEDITQVNLDITQLERVLTVLSLLSEGLVFLSPNPNHSERKHALTINDCVVRSLTQRIMIHDNRTMNGSTFYIGELINVDLESEDIMWLNLCFDKINNLDIMKLVINHNFKFFNGIKVEPIKSCILNKHVTKKNSTCGNSQFKRYSSDLKIFLSSNVSWPMMKGVNCFPNYSNVGKEIFIDKQGLNEFRFDRERKLEELVEEVTLKTKESVLDEKENGKKEEPFIEVFGEKIPFETKELKSNDVELNKRIQTYNFYKLNPKTNFELDLFNLLLLGSFDYDKELQKLNDKYEEERSEIEDFIRRTDMCGVVPEFETKTSMRKRIKNYNAGINSLKYKEGLMKCKAKRDTELNYIESRSEFKENIKKFLKSIPNYEEFMDIEKDYINIGCSKDTYNRKLINYIHPFQKKINHLNKFSELVDRAKKRENYLHLFNLLTGENEFKNKLIKSVIYKAISKIRTSNIVSRICYFEEIETEQSKARKLEIDSLKVKVEELKSEGKHEEFIKEVIKLKRLKASENNFSILKNKKRGTGKGKPKTSEKKRRPNLKILNSWETKIKGIRNKRVKSVYIFAKNMKSMEGDLVKYFNEGIISDLRKEWSKRTKSLNLRKMFNLFLCICEKEIFGGTLSKRKKIIEKGNEYVDCEKMII